MASITKILKNTTQNEYRLVTKQLLPDVATNIPTNLWLDLKDRIDEQNFPYNEILSGDIIVNNGIKDLSAAEGVEWCRELGYHDPTSTVLGMSYSMVFVDNGRAGNEWLKHYDSNILSNSVNGVIPFDSKLVAITFSNANQNAQAGIEVWKYEYNDGDNKTKILDWLINSHRVGYKTNFSSEIVFNAGDRIATYIDDNGNRIGLGGTNKGYILRSQQ